MLSPVCFTFQIAAVVALKIFVEGGCCGCYQRTKVTVLPPCFHHVVCMIFFFFGSELPYLMTTTTGIVKQLVAHILHRWPISFERGPCIQFLLALAPKIDSSLVRKQGSQRIGPPTLLSVPAVGCVVWFHGPNHLLY